MTNVLMIISESPACGRAKRQVQFSQFEKMKKKYKLISRDSEKRWAGTKAHVDTFTQLNEVELALKPNQTEKNLLAEQEESHQKGLSKKMNNATSNL